MCPNCHKNTFSAWEKLHWSPDKPLICKKCEAHVKPSIIHFAISFLLMMIASLGLGFFGTELIYEVPIYSLHLVETTSKYFELIFLSLLGATIPVILELIYFGYFMRLQIDEDA